MNHPTNVSSDLTCQGKTKARVAAHYAVPVLKRELKPDLATTQVGPVLLHSVNTACLANPDIHETLLFPDILQLLLRDHSSGRNIIWATDDYAERGEGYRFADTIEVPLITGENEGLIKPRSEKAKSVQQARSRQKAEVFTPSWVCNRQNNLIDEAWFGRKDVFNHENGNHTWTTRTEPVLFPDTEGKTWRNYVKDVRMEITCGEAPYLTGRYDTVTGEPIAPFNRIGILDRKFRIVYENNGTDREPKKWYKWMKIALQSVYGYEWQGDNLLLARENILSSYMCWHVLRFGSTQLPPQKILHEIIDIITWNIWQMDGLKGVIPGSCVARAEQDPQMSLFPTDTPVQSTPCPACMSGVLRDMPRHTGIRCHIKDWDLPHDGKHKKELFFSRTP